MKNFIQIISIAVSIFLVQPKAISQLDSLSNYFTHLDSLVETKMGDMHIPGATVTIIKDGKLLMNKGYGLADIDNGRTVDPEKTVFRVASITKPFTAMAIMKLVEEGKLNLHADIRPLIKDKYDFDWKHPVSIHHIMTHTTGLDYSSIGSHIKVENDNSKKVKLLSQGHKPGDHIAYSNIAFGLLGYLIEKTSGVSYHQYMKTNILDPLGMHHSTFDTNLPEDLARDRALPYKWKDSRQVLQERQGLTVPAASSLEATGGDMALFMNAVIHPQIFADAGIISRESFDLMTSPKHPERTMLTIGYSFFLGNTNNRPSIFHSGGLRGFLSLYTVVREAKMGVFISQSNRYGAESFAYDLTSDIYDELMPAIQADLSWVKNKEDRSIPISAFEGVYRTPSERNSTFEKSQEIVDRGEVRIKAIGNDTLEIFGHKYVRIANLTFVSHRDNSEWVQQFRADDNGNITRMITATQTFMKTPWYKRILVTQLILGFGFLFFLVSWIIGVWRWVKKENNISPNLFEKWIRFVGLGYVLTFMAMFVANLLVDTVKEGIPLSFKLPLITFSVFGLFSLLFPWAIWRNYKSNLSKNRKVYNYIAIGIIVTLTYILWHYRLIGMWY